MYNVRYLIHEIINLISNEMEDILKFHKSFSISSFTLKAYIEKFNYPTDRKYDYKIFLSKKKKKKKR